MAIDLERRQQAVEMSGGCLMPIHLNGCWTVDLLW